MGAQQAATGRPVGGQPASTSPATPLRTLGQLSDSGYRLLRDTGSTYRDGGEQAVLDLVSSAVDLRSDSPEMVVAANGWAQRYHVDPARANVLRCLALPADARVLEIGAGCGAITRYLGENCAIVDSLEPVPIRAAAARARCRDLPGVEVFVGDLDDVPDEPAYDVVVVIGVLEYVGAGTAGRAPYLAFLSKIASRLRDGGTLVLAIENRLGVKYLAGAPEDHTNRAFDSVEGYPRGGHARTFGRGELESLLREAGLAPTTRIVFPDYKLTRAVFDQFPAPGRSLLHRIPAFPSPDWRSPRPRLLDERLLWRELVEAGLDAEFGNSFLSLAIKGAGPELWPAGQLGAFYATDRIPSLNTATVIESAGDDIVLRRAPLRPATESADTSDPHNPSGPATAPRSSVVHVVPSTSPYQPGTDLTQVIADGGVDAWSDLVDQWLRLVDVALIENPVTAVDVVPHNLVVDANGQLQLIDVELAFAGITRGRLLRRGIFWLADRVAPLAPPARWAPARTVGDLMRELGAIAGLAPDGSWIERAVAEETDFLAQVRPAPAAGPAADEWRARIAARTEARVNRPLAELPLGERLPERASRLVKDLAAARRAAADAQAAAEAARTGEIVAREKAEAARAELSAALRRTDSARADLASVRRRLDRTEATLKQLEGMVAVRVIRRGRRAFGRLVPAGSGRRRLLGRVFPPGTARRRLVDRLRAR